MKNSSIFGIVLLIIVLIILIPAIVMWLWNGLIVGLFELPTISYWQAWGLMILFNLLFNLGSYSSK